MIVSWGLMLKKEKVERMWVYFCTLSCLNVFKVQHREQCDELR